MMLRVVIGALAFGGLLISAYFAAVYHKWISDIDRFVPRVCRLEPGACATILETREARLLGVPNFDLGLLFYVGLVISVFLPAAWTELHAMLVFGSMVAVAMGFYLTYALLFRLKIHCNLCYTSHAINVVVCILLLATP